MSPQSPLETYFADFGAWLGRLAEARGVAIETPTIDSHVAAAVLELAGAVAHSSESTLGRRPQPESRSWWRCQWRG